MDLKALIAAYEQIARFGFPFLIFLALVGSYYGIWEWGAAVRLREAKQEARELALEAKYKAEIQELKSVATLREASQQVRIDQLFDKMIEAAGLIEKSARQVSR